MSGIKLDIVTAERAVYSEEVDLIVAPGIDGQLGILPHHTPLMTMIQPGELMLKKGDEEFILAVTGGFLEVRPDRVIILADAAERVEEIDEARAEEARRRAQERIQRPSTEVDLLRAEASLKRAILRLQLVEKRKKRNIRPSR
ncbi:F0F1 ATP synthase subunit epsilon [Chloroflexota bacterium]